MVSEPFQPRTSPRPEIEQALSRAITLSTGDRLYRITAWRLLSEQHRVDLLRWQ